MSAATRDDDGPTPSTEALDAWRTIARLPILARVVLVTLAFEHCPHRLTPAHWAALVGVGDVELASALDALAEFRLLSLDHADDGLAIELRGPARQLADGLRTIPSASASPPAHSAFSDGSAALFSTAAAPPRTGMSITPSPETAFLMRERARQARYRQRVKALRQAEKSAAESASQRFGSASERRGARSALSSDASFPIGARASSAPPVGRRSERPMDSRADQGGARARAQSDKRGGEEAKSKQASLDALFESIATDLGTLDDDARALETLRRAAVYKRLRASHFGHEGSDQRKDALPERMCYRISLAPWVSEKLAAFAVWEARDLAASYRKKGKAFNAIGHVIAATGTRVEERGGALRVVGEPHVPSGAFEATWRTQSAIERMRQAKENRDG